MIRFGWDKLKQFLTQANTWTGIQTLTTPKVDHIEENSSGHGVVCDGVTLKDGGALIITGGTNTFNVTNGTASLDVATAKTVNIDDDVTVAAELHVEAATHVNQDLTTDATPTFAGVYKKAVIVDGSTGLTLSAAQVSDTIISNTGQGVNNVNHALPTAAAGYHFKSIIGETQGASYFRFTRSGSDTIIADGTSGKTYINEASPSQGDAIEFYTLQVASTGIKTGAALAIGGTKTNVYSGAFTFDIGGTGYAKSAVAAGTAPNAVTTPQNKYGAQAFDIGADGTIDAISCTNIATGFDSAALAVADLPAVAASHVRMGYVTAMNSAEGGFVWATTEFDAATVTEDYTSSTAYTKPYVWIATPIKGTWATD